MPISTHHKQFTHERTWGNFVTQHYEMWMGNSFKRTYPIFEKIFSFLFIIHLSIWLEGRRRGVRCCELKNHCTSYTHNVTAVKVNEVASLPAAIVFASFLISSFPSMSLSSLISSRRHRWGRYICIQTNRITFHALSLLSFSQFVTADFHFIRIGCYVNDSHFQGFAIRMRLQYEWKVLLFIFFFRNSEWLQSLRCRACAGDLCIFPRIVVHYYFYADVKQIFFITKKIYYMTRKDNDGV